MAQTQVTQHRIAKAGTIRPDHRESSVPFSHHHGRHQVVGYSQDLMLRVAEAIKTELKPPALPLKLVPVTFQHRVLLAQNGTIDLECGASTRSREHERQVAFSTSILVVGALGVERNALQRIFL